MHNEVRGIGVIGAGVMGHGVAQIAAMAGFNVVLIDINEDILKKALNNITWSLNKFVEKGKISAEESNEVIKRIKTSINIEDVKNMDFIIEAIPEDLKLKKEVFSKLDEVSPKHAILATNTSSLSITEISKATKRPEKVIGMHFFNPPQLMKLVEIIKGKYTSEEAIKITINIAKKMDKTTIIVNKDVPGFVVNRIFHMALHEAFWSVFKGESTIEEIDATLEQHGFPMGFFRLVDHIGLDVIYHVDEILYKAYGERMNPSPLITSMVNKGLLGKKIGKGFYDWTIKKLSIPQTLSIKSDIIERIYAVVINEAAFLIYEDVASPNDIDLGVKLGTNWPKGPCELGDELGLDDILNKLNSLYKTYNSERYKPCPLLEIYVNKNWIGKKSKKGFYEYS
ncbi:MAG: 3-hydroxyacyl-CoA dehydrogenase [Candidatus Methanomethylicia archaeon]